MRGAGLAAAGLLGLLGLAKNESPPRDRSGGRGNGSPRGTLDDLRDCTRSECLLTSTMRGRARVRANRYPLQNAAPAAQAARTTIKSHDPTRRRSPGKRGTWRKSATRNEAGEKDCGQHAAHGGWRGTRGFLTRQRRHLVTGGASRASRGRSRASTAALPPAPEASHRAACLRPEDQPRSTTDQVDQEQIKVR